MGKYMAIVIIKHLGFLHDPSFTGINSLNAL